MKINLLLLVFITGFALDASCQISTLNFSVTQIPCTIGIPSQEEIQPDVSIFPNPSAGKFNLSIKSSTEFNLTGISIYSVMGERILILDERKISTIYESNFNLTTFPVGIYFVQVNFANASSKVLRIALND